MDRFPSSAVSYFWDADPQKLDPEKDHHFIIQRLLECGDLSEVRWLLRTYLREDLKSELKTCRSLSPRSAAFWALLLDVPVGDLRCTQRRSDPQQKTAWPY